MTKRITLFALVACALAFNPAFAGPPDMKQVAPAPPPCEFGTGWYFGLDGGANVYQMFDDSFSRTLPNGSDIHLHIDHNVGGYGGIKLGYVFGTGAWRPAIEEDMFYNGLSTSAHLDVNGTEVASGSNMINSGAFMTNFILRYAGWGKFQPYAGAGIGAYYAESGGGDITVTVPGPGPTPSPSQSRTISTGGGRSSGSLAWDVVAGGDYYWSCKSSVFIEYHFLDYVALDVGDGNHQFGQHLVGAGLRFHF